PPPPTAFAANVTNGATHLSWAPSAAPDFATFRLYRGTSAGFVPAPANRVLEASGTSYVDDATGGGYALTAVDRNGNESACVTAAAVVTGVEPRAVFALHGALQTPARGDRLDIAFSLANAGRARLELYDVGGRRVASCELGGLTPGA